MSLKVTHVHGYPAKGWLALTQGDAPLARVMHGPAHDRLDGATG